MKKLPWLFALSLNTMLISAQTEVADIEKLTKTLEKQSEETVAKNDSTKNLFEMNVLLQVSNVGFVNWVAGGDNMFNSRMVVFLHDNVTKGKFSLVQKFDARFGYTAVNWKEFRKSEDEFTYNILGLYGLGKGWSVAAMGNLRSQFANGFVTEPNPLNSNVDTTYRASAIFAPAYLDLSLGFNYKKAPFSVTISPVAGNFIFVADKKLAEADIVGIGADKQFLAQLGASFRAELDIKFAKNMLRYRSYLFSFVSYTGNNHIPLVRWENTLDFALNKWFTASVYALFYYDKMQSDQPQLNYSFGLGLAYAFKTAHTKGN